MSTVVVPSRFGSWYGLTVGLRACCWVLLLAVEMVSLTVCFDTNVFDGQRHWVVEILARSSAILQVGIVAFGAALLFGGSSWLHRLEEADALFEHPRLSLTLLLHLFSFGAFFWTTSVVISSQFSQLSSPTLAALAWAATGAVSIALSATVVLPLRGWAHVLFEQRWSVLAGTAAGIFAWYLGRLVQVLWEPFAYGTFNVVVALLRLFDRHAVSDPSSLTVGTDSFLVTIAPACSGLEGIGLIVTFVGAYLWLLRRQLRFPHALGLLPVGIAAIWFANALRITALILLGDLGFTEFAVGAFHSRAGSLLFAGVGLAVVALSHRVCVVPQSRQPGLGLLATPTAAFLMPLVVWHAVPMLAMTSGPVDYWYGIRVVAVTCVVAWYRPHYGNILRGSSWAAVGIGVAVFGVWWALEPGTWRGVATPAPVEVTQLGTFALAGWLLFRVVGSVALVPIAEELAFRGYLARRLVDADFCSISLRSWTWVALFVSSLAFGALHGERWFAGSLAGLLFAVAAIRRCNLADAVVAHAIANACVAGFVLATGNWSMWQ